MRKTLITLLLACTPLHADDDSFRERFADPATRTAALAELVPGTRDAYFHTALDHQLAGRVEEFNKTMAEWLAAAQRRENPVSHDGMVILENRKLLMDYQNNPVQSLAGLIRKLDLKFDDTKPDAAAAAESLPTKVDPALVSDAAFEKAAAEKSPKTPYRHYTKERRLRELDQVESFDEAKVRWFVSNIDRADLPGIVPLVDRALQIDRTLSFTDNALLKNLTKEQLDSLLALHPDLRAKDSFPLAYLKKLRPGTETDFELDTRAHAEHLRKCLEFTVTLPPSQNSLKAHVLYHHLRLQAELGAYPKADFLSYLALPRRNGDLLKLQENENQDTVNNARDFMAATSCRAVGDDTKLVEDLLRHFLGGTDSAADFAPYVQEKPLLLLHARARLLAGGDPAVWGKLLDPAEFKELQEQTAIGFSRGAPKLLDGDAAVSLALDLKNAPSLLVRIYELDLPAHLANHGEEPAVSIDLDGLVPHHERTLTWDQAPLVEHRESIGLPELAGPGAWLVDFTSGQVSARALIRKGHLSAFPERTATGQVVRVFDEKGAIVPTAVLTLGTESFTADASGRITIPNAPSQPVREGIIRAGKLAIPLKVDPRADALAMDANFILDREQLLADQEAKLNLRVRLTNHGHELPLDRIQDPALVLKAELLGGVTTERVIAENLKLAPAMEIPFQVPADLLKLTLTLRGTVTPATGGDALKLSQEQTYDLNADLKGARVATPFFSPVADGHRLEIRGRNGEPLPSRAVTLSFDTRNYHANIELKARTDADGRVDLGPLDAVSSVRVTGTDVGNVRYFPALHLPTPPPLIQVRTGKEIRVPLENRSEVVNHLHVSLVELVDGFPIRDHFNKLSIDGGQLLIKDLPPGTFRLDQPRRSTKITVSSGEEKDGLLVSRNQILPVLQPVSPTIASARTENDGVRIQLRATGPDTRVTLVGKRYANLGWSATWKAKPFTPWVPGVLTPGFTTCGFLTERLLSDETRYILDRRAIRTFPGSMLPRPSLLLNRWSDDEINQAVVSGNDGGEGLSSGREFRQAKAGGGGNLIEQPGTNNRIEDVRDFLRFPSVVKFDVKPEADGTVTLPLAQFEGSQFIEIIATDTFASDSLVLPLPANDTPLRDRRIARPFDPQAHHLANRSAAVLREGAEASIENLLDADWRAFTTLAEAHQFLYGIQPDDPLREFVFVTEWPSFTEETKLELLEKHACHELHLFLSRKDKAFFDKFVKPRLAGKAQPRFMDDYLLGRDLTPYLRPYAWDRLNAAEKALLSQAMPDARATITRELSLSWELDAPTADQDTRLFTQTLRGSDLALEDSLGLVRAGGLLQENVDLPDDSMASYGGSADSEGAPYIEEKLKRIIIPRIDFEDTTVEEAIDFLRLRSSELDTNEVDPAKKGVNIVVRRPRNADGSNDPGLFRIRELRVRNVPLVVALKYICDQTKLRVKTDDFAVTLVPQTESGEDIFTRTFRVPPNFGSLIDGGSEMDPADPFADPFAEPSDRPAKIQARKPVKELLAANGITFAEGSSATLSSNGVLIITNTPSELDKIEQLTSVIASQKPDGAVLSALPMPAMEAGADADPFAEPSVGGANKIQARRPAKANRELFPERTRLWRESNYYRATGPGVNIPLNRFWLDLAAWDGQGPFLSPHFNACHTSANEALMCLALLDLPFKAERPEVVVDGSTLKVKAREPMVLFYKDTRKTENVAPESPLLVRQTFSPQAEPFRTVNGRQVENPVTGDFRPGVAYTASLIVTNPTGIGRRIDLLAQVPAGSIPLGGRPATLSSTHELAPYGVVTEKLEFYFPATGDFTVYPLHVSEEGTVLAHTDARTLTVSGDTAPQDAASWGVLAAEGTNEEVLNRLAIENLNTINLKLIRWRLQDAPFFLSVSKLLRERLHFSPEVASYGFRHNDVPAMREYLENAGNFPNFGTRAEDGELPPVDLPDGGYPGLLNRVGYWLDSPLLDLRPLVHSDWQTLEFDPLVNARAHQLGEQPRMTHEAARRFYQEQLDLLSWKPALDDADQLQLAMLLFLQDRIAEGLERFDKINPAKLPGTTTYDYLHAVVLFHRENPVEAKALATRVLPTLPPGLWHDRFQAVVDQADEIAALANPGEDEKTRPEQPAPSLDLALAEGGKLLVRHRSLDNASLRLFSVDLEVLFSKNPFLKGEGDNGQPAILPNARFELPLAKDAAETTVDLPEGLRKGNVLVSADSGSRKVLKVLDSRDIELRQSATERTVQVLDAANHRPLPKSYVKVYAETNTGEIAFHKDGYTDLRGKFDYLSHTGIDVSTIKRVAVLVSHPEKGARTVIYER